MAKKNFYWVCDDGWRNNVTIKGREIEVQAGFGDDDGWDEGCYYEAETEPTKFKFPRNGSDFAIDPMVDQSDFLSKCLDAKVSK